MPRIIPQIRGGFFLSRSERKIPEHVAVIMDGNGRWANNRGLPRIEGHKAGAKSVKTILKAAVEVGVKYLTIYTFSADNWKRPEDETTGLMRLIEENLNRELPELIDAGVRVCVLGDTSKIPDSTQQAFEEAYNLTKNLDKLILYVALNYSGRNEIVDASKKIIDAVQSGHLDKNMIDEELFRSYLYAPDVPYPELLIRSGGEMRVSNFLLWEIAYSEIWVSPVLWPDFKRKHFIAAVKDYSKRNRRYGGLDPL